MLTVDYYILIYIWSIIYDTNIYKNSMETSIMTLYIYLLATATLTHVMTLVWRKTFSCRVNGAADIPQRRSRDTRPLRVAKQRIFEGMLNAPTSPTIM